MKRLTALAAAAALLLSLCGCFHDPLPTHDEPLEATEQQAAVNTEAATPGLTAEPEPTAAPSPAFTPYTAATGKLTDGPMLPEGSEYLVIKGESDLYYVYNGEGELFDTFHAVDEEDWYCCPGIYGPQGVVCGRMIATGEQIGDLNYLGDIIFTIESWYREGSGYYEYGIYIKDVYNSRLEPMCSFAANRAEIGHIGGIIHIDGKLIVMDRDYDWSSGSAVYNTEPDIYSESGEYLGKLDASPFGHICGVLGGKYLVCYSPDMDIDEYPMQEALIHDVYTLDGTLVMQNVGIIVDSGFNADDETWQGYLASVKYVVNSAGEAFDGELRPAEKPDDPYKYYGELSEPYRCYDGDDFRYTAGNVYTGVKDAEGNWLFRIYNPGNASDSDNSEGDRFWQVYRKFSELQYYWWDD